MSLLHTTEDLQSLSALVFLPSSTSSRIILPRCLRPFCLDVYAEDSESHVISALFRSPVQLASLSTLTIQAFSGNKADVHEALLREMMSRLNLPALQKLDLVGLTYVLPLKMASIIPSPRHLTSLRSLILSDIYTGIPELTELLSNYRALTELSLCLDKIGPIPISPVSILHSLRHGAHTQDWTTSQLPSYVGHNFPFLASFNFGFWCSTVEESKAVAAEFSTLLSTWLTDVYRQTPLKKASFYISDQALDNKPGHDTVLGWLSEQLPNLGMAQDNTESTPSQTVDDLDIKEITSALWRNNSRPSACAQRKLEGLRASASAVIAGIDNDLLGVQVEVNRLLEKIRSLLEVRSHQENLVKGYSAQLSSVRLLPSDVLVEIFKYALPERLNSSPKLFPLALRCVCSAWREAILAYPSLWNGLLPLDPNLAPGDKNYIQYGFSCTPTGTLSFSIYSPGQSHRINYHYIEIPTVFRSISPFYHLLSKLDINVRSFQNALPFFFLPSGSIPLLEEIRLEIEYKQVGRVTKPWTVFQDAPRLRRVQFTLPPDLSRDQLADVLPWNQFTHVVFSNSIELPLFAKIIFQSTQLHDASFCLDVYAEDSKSHVISELCKTPVRLANLSELAIEAFSGNKAEAHEELLGEIISKLDLPALQRLDFVGLTYAPSLKMATIIPTTPHNLTSLRNLILTDIHTTTLELTDLLSNCHSLTELALCLDTLTPVPTNPVLILRSLRYSTHAPDQSTSQPPSNVGHNFACLSSFTFGFRCSTVEESDAVAVEFSTLINIWLIDGSRRTDLKEVGFYISDQELDNKPGHLAVFMRLRQRLHKWIARRNAHSDKALNLTTHLITGSTSVGSLSVRGIL
ncbi:hypothetical protein H0H81_012274 [Sphagnurus paluster]|uniref:F-box domain-containing protein n=1 Tax=Sphagnurus paluster TaxID=117069 RepID=A0A9P7FU31_9AGAR|nr:hypothetical protein H0H81_012274 [Sphagnurus paluster]